MFTRVGGTALAMLAAAALVLSIAGALGPLPGWWSGHPNVQGTLIRAKHVDIGLLETKGCNTGGDRTCQPVGVTGTVAMTGYVAAGAIGLLAIAAALLAITAAIESERRKSLAKLAVFAVVVAGIVAIALIVQGPGIEARTGDNKLLNVSVPLGIGTYLFAAGLMSAIGASVLALRPTRPPQPAALGFSPRQLGTGPSAAMQPGQVDVLALLQDDTLRPAALGPEPMIGRSTPGPPSTGPFPGAFPGAGGPLGLPTPTGGAQPLFSGAPQLRPLYEAAPDLGGTGGFVPLQPPPSRMMRPPTPIPRDQIAAIAGIPTPPAFDAAPGADGFAFGAEAPASDPMEAFAPPPPPPRRHPPSRPPELPSAAIPIATPPDPSSRRMGTALGAPPAPQPPPPPELGRAGSPELRSGKTLPPPIRNKSTSAPPLSIGAGASQPPRPSAAVPSPQPPRAGASGPIPQSPRSGASGPIPQPRAGASGPIPQSPRSGASGPIPRPIPNAGSRSAPASKPPPVGDSAGPTPSVGAPFVPLVPFPSPASKARLAPRPPTDPLERASTNAFQAGTEPYERQEESAMARLRAEGDATGLTEAPPDFETATAEGRSFATDQDLPLVKPSPEAIVEAADAAVAVPAGAEPGPAADDDASKSQPDRLARGLRNYKLTGTRPPETAERLETSPLIPPPPPSASPAVPAALASTAPPSPGTGPASPAPPVSASSSSPKLPMSTAPSSLPPPSEKQSMTSGPSPACPQCEAPMAWVEEHLRFYCKSCKMYF